MQNASVVPRILWGCTIQVHDTVSSNSLDLWETVVSLSKSGGLCSFESLAWRGILCGNYRAVYSLLTNITRRKSCKNCWSKLVPAVVCRAQGYKMTANIVQQDMSKFRDESSQGLSQLFQTWVSSRDFFALAPTGMCCTCFCLIQYRSWISLHVPPHLLQVPCKIQLVFTRMHSYVHCSLWLLFSPNVQGLVQMSKSVLPLAPPVLS